MRWSIPWVRTRRSAGVLVTSRVYALIAQGNAARTQGHWKEAANLYEKALAADPHLAHVWVQLGHMRKEAGSPVEAAAAYIRAFKEKPDDPAMLLLLGEAATRVPADRRDALAGMLQSALSRHDPGRQYASVAFNRGGAEVAAAGETVFDASDLFSYFLRARLPTGIQRVQIEIIAAAMARSDLPVRVCCSVEGRDCWVEVPAHLFVAAAQLAKSGGRLDDVAWLRTMTEVQLVMLLGDPIRFGAGARLVNLGTSWWLQNYFLQVRNAQCEYGIRYVPFVHDLIPVLAPQHCVDGLVEDFVSWIVGVFAHADRFLVNSEATRRDLIRVAATMGRTLDFHAATVVPLDAAFASHAAPGNVAEPDPRLDALLDQRFVMFVSTIESRKGHLTALQAWQQLLREYPTQDVPLLVCVGNNGWLNEAVYATLDADETLAAHVVLLSKVADANLLRLYQRCLFTIYPSTFEGWGLPITEALSHGKPVIAADNTSLREAGGAAAIYVPTGSASALAEAVAALAFDPKALAAAHQQVADNFRPRQWSDVADQLLATLAAMPAIEAGARPPALQLRKGQWYSLAREGQRRVWPGIGSAEIARQGRGWAARDDRASWIVGSAQLACDLEEPASAARLAIKLVARRTICWTVAVDGVVAATGTISAGENGWCSCHIPPRACAAATMSVTISAAEFPAESGSASGDPACGVAGICLLDEHAETGADGGANAEGSVGQGGGSIARMTIAPAVQVVNRGAPSAKMLTAA